MADYTPGPGPRAVPAVIEDGEVVARDMVDLKDRTLCGVFAAPPFDGTYVYFRAYRTESGEDYYEIQGPDGLYSVPLVEGYLSVDPDVFRGVRYLRIVTDAPQTADATFYLAVR